MTCTHTKTHMKKPRHSGARNSKDKGSKVLNICILSTNTSTTGKKHVMNVNDSKTKLSKDSRCYTNQTFIRVKGC